MQYTILFCYDHFYFPFSWLKEMEEHMRSMLHHRELENLKGRYENNLESVLAVQFVCYTLEELMCGFPYKLNCQFILCVTYLHAL